MELLKAVEIVRENGIEVAREMAATPLERRLVDVAYEVMADEQQAIGFAYSGMCLTGLPYRRLPDDQPWVKKGYQVSLMIEPGRLIVRGKPVLFGVPWGSRGRILLIHLMTQAVRTGSREVTLGRSAKHALERMGLSYGGETGRAVRDQGARLSACHLRWSWEKNGGDTNHRGAIISSSFTLHEDGGDNRQGSLFSDAVILDPDFFNALKSHPVPIAEEAVRQLSYSPMALDIYTWLGYRLHHLERAIDVSWAALMAQFGSHYKALRHFRGDFTPALSAACAAYPDAKVELLNEGVNLAPSHPPVSKLVSLPSLPPKRRK
jgi:hypothetical protein